MPVLPSPCGPAAPPSSVPTCTVGVRQAAMWGSAARKKAAAGM